MLTLFHLVTLLELTKGLLLWSPGLQRPLNLQKQVESSSVMLTVHAMLYRKHTALCWLDLGSQPDFLRWSMPLCLIALRGHKAGPSSSCLTRTFNGNSFQKQANPGCVAYTTPGNASLSVFSKTSCSGRELQGNIQRENSIRSYRSCTWRYLGFNGFIGVSWYTWTRFTLPL